MIVDELTPAAAHTQPANPANNPAERPSDGLVWKMPDAPKPTKKNPFPMFPPDLQGILKNLIGELYEGVIPNEAKANALRGLTQLNLSDKRLAAGKQLIEEIVKGYRESVLDAYACMRPSVLD